MKISDVMYFILVISAAVCITTLFVTGLMWLENKHKVNLRKTNITIPISDSNKFIQIICDEHIIISRVNTDTIYINLTK